MKAAQQWWLGVAATSLVFAALMALTGCGLLKPKPEVPPGEVSCDNACTYVAAMKCGTSRALCDRLCSNIAENDPTYPTCLAGKESCAGLDECGKEPSK